VNRIYTDMAVIDVTRDGLVLREITPGFTVDDVQKVTEPKLIVAEDLREIEV
jgi:acyl CoA:acetate/3-ketoacid CoA transferase beta subunit